VMAKPVSLALHKTNRARRRAKSVRRELRAFTGAAQRALGTNLTGYALVVWADDGRAIADWMGGVELKGYPVEDFARNMIVRTKNKQDAKDAIFGPDDDAA